MYNLLNLLNFTIVDISNNFLKLEELNFTDIIKMGFLYGIFIGITVNIFALGIKYVSKILANRF